MTRILLHWLVSASAIYITALFIKGIEVDNFWAAMAVAFVMGLFNAIVRPIILFFSMPLVILSLGLLIVIINGAFLYFASAVIEGFRVQSFWTACFGSVIISVFSFLLGWLIGLGKSDKEKK
ncbi:MAG: phage holin family protein [Chloroherpetonaceae bacterium]|nr:phage holin family protein [Chloroherpetonaceae bacterium]